ncbi:glycosyltransferase family 2 protein [Patescibacteria group bacterium]|nr:glycosyltransferase family 2 protein [Patescibacteria group bacterium]
MKLSVIIPAYNESKRIIPTLESVQNYLQNQEYESEVIVVANGCSDDTVEVANLFQGKINNLNVLNIEAKGGKGWAVKEGMAKAKGEVAVFMDADNATKLSEMDHFWKYFNQGYDVVIGSRALAQSKITQKQPFYRRWLGKSGNLLIRMVLIPGIHDTQCGFKAFTSKAYDDIFSRLTIFGWGFDMEVLAIARHKGYNVKEEPVTWHDIGESRVEPIKAALNTLKELYIIRKNLIKGTYGRAAKKREHK